MNHADRRHGFTLIELMLAMGFVSALLLAIAMTVIQIGNIYNRGLTFKNVNQAGSVIANELQKSITYSTSFDVNVPSDGNGINYIKKPESGRLCLGKYSYVWNYGKYIKTPSSNYIKYKDSGAKIYFAKVYDLGASICTKVGAVYPDIVRSDAVELIDDGQYDLAIHSFSIKTYASATDAAIGQELYSVEFLLGTNDQSAFDFGTTTCAVSGSNSNPIYCSMGRFNIVARAGNAINAN